MHIKITIFVGLIGAAVGYTSDRSPQRFSQPEQPDYDDKSAAGTFASHESFYDSGYDDSRESYHTSDDGSQEYDAYGSSEYSPSEKSNSHGSNEPPKWDGPVALPPGYEPNGQPHPVQDLPAVVAERQKHFHLFAHGPHAGAVAAAQPYLKPVQGGFSTPWVPIIVPIHHHQPQAFHQQPVHHNHINYHG